MATQIIPRVRVYERGTGTDIYFGEQVTERYTREDGCFAGDTEISCTPITERRCTTYTALLACNPGCRKVSLFRCECCGDEPTGKKTCQCERKVAEALPPPANGGGGGGIGPIGGIGLPPIMGAAGTGVAEAAPARSPIATLLLLGGLLAVGFYVYNRYIKKG